MLRRKFFTRPTLKVCQEVLGKYIVRKYRGKEIVGKIVEVEAYPGPYDKASHAFNNKKTPRNQAEYMQGGHVYIYLVYGMYWQLNISTGKEDYPECFLIRAAEPLANGPGKLCQALKLNKTFYAEDLTASKRLWLEDRGDKIKKSQIVACPRIGIDYAGPTWSKKLWRFYIKGNHFVSRLK